MSKEKWKKCFQGLYAVSSYGRIKLRRCQCCGHKLHKKFISPHSRGEYLGVYLNGKSYYLHCVVAEAFLGPRPKGMEVNHKDGDKYNARLDNLEYLTHTQNMSHARKNGLCDFNHAGNKNPNAVASKDIAKYIRRKYRKYRTNKMRHKLARKFGLSNAAVDDIVYGRTWSSR